MRYLGNINVEKMVINIPQHPAELSWNSEHHRPNSNGHFPPMTGVNKPRIDEAKYMIDVYCIGDKYLLFSSSQLAAM